MRLSSLWLGINLGLMLAPPFVVTEHQKPTFVVTERESPPAAPARPRVKLYWADWCGICPQVKAEIEAAQKAGKLPFEVDLVDGSKEGSLPPYCKYLPMFTWPHSSKPGWVHHVQNYQGVDNLVATWKANQSSQKAR